MCDYCTDNAPLSKMALKNIHFREYPLTLNMTHDEDGYGLAVMEHRHSVKAVFDIKFCPMCGRALIKEANP